ncbi:MAG: hypothetical protein KDJ15_00845 [Alphaproteobacteria bacterium]|nr:hypothetical protein [Alphaproteobacteria bacterium]
MGVNEHPGDIDAWIEGQEEKHRATLSCLKEAFEQALEASDEDAMRNTGGLAFVMKVTEFTSGSCQNMSVPETVKARASEAMIAAFKRSSNPQGDRSTIVLAGLQSALNVLKQRHKSLILIVS